MMRALATITACLMALSRIAFAQQELGNVDQGHEFVKQTCVECHRVEKDQKRPKLSLARPFQDIADDAAWTALSLGVFLRTPHKDMPDFVLSNVEIDNVVAYILSLK